MKRLANLAMLLAIKLVGQALWRWRCFWVGGEEPGDAWSDLRVLVLLNHTSLYEPLLLAGTPWPFLRSIAGRMVVPVAARTLSRPMVRFFYSMAFRAATPVTRRRDRSWESFLSSVEGDAFTIFLPEGRMKRSNGLDKNGRPMTVRPGIADVLERVGEGRMFLAYSGGLHQVQAPGELLPRLFRKIGLGFEVVDIAGYLEHCAASGGGDLRAGVVQDLEARRDRWAPAAAEHAGIEWVGPPAATTSSPARERATRGTI